MADRVAKVYDLLEYRAKPEARKRAQCGCPVCQGFLSPLFYPRGTLTADEDGKLVFVHNESTWGVFPDA